MDELEENPIAYQFSLFLWGKIKLIHLWNV